MSSICYNASVVIQYLDFYTIINMTDFQALHAELCSGEFSHQHIYVVIYVYPSLFASLVGFSDHNRNYTER